MWPPRLSMARAMSASGDLKPNAMRVMSLILVFIDSTRPLERPCSIQARIAARWLTIVFCSFTNAAIRQRRAQPTSRAERNAARAQRAEADLTKIRGELDHARIVHDIIREEASSLRVNLATAIAQRDAAWADARRERSHGDQRVGDLRTTQHQQLAQLHDRTAWLRQEVCEQNGRADRAEAHPIAQTDAATTKPALLTNPDK